MEPVIETATPFDRSILWELHHAYFATRGTDAWKAGDIPFFSTSNGAWAAQHARLLQALVADLEAEGRLAVGAPVVVLECAGGAGVFASNFLFALEDLDAGLAARTRYVFTDYMERSLREAIATPPLARWYQAGRVIPARLDVTRPDELAPLDGHALPGRPAFVIANYTCCVIPMKHLAVWSSEDWQALHVAVGGIEDDPEARDRETFLASVRRDPTRARLMQQVDVVWTWEPTELAHELPDPVHQRAIRRAVDGLVDATVAWPVRWFDFLRHVATSGWLADGGVVLTADFGTSERKRLKGRTTGRPELYGNTLNQPVNLSLFEPFADEAGLHILRTTEDLTSLNSALTGASPFGQRTAAAFEALYTRIAAADDALDFWHAAHAFYDKKQNLRALRFWLRCAELDHHNAEHRYRIGELALELGQHDRAIAQLLVGYELDPDFTMDFDFQLGRAYAAAGDHRSAMGWYERSAAREPHPVTWTNLGVIQMHEGLFAEAYHSLKQARMMDPRYPMAEQRLQGLKDAVWLKAIKDFEEASARRRAP